jgi:site-specific recombinase XerD
MILAVGNCSEKSRRRYSWRPVLQVFRGAPTMSDFAPATVKGTVARRRAPPKRLKNAQTRPREYLTEAEVQQLMQAARKRGRWGHRDETMILVAFRHGLRVSELVSLRWDQVDFTSSHLHVNRLKRGRNSQHPISGAELRALRRLKREQPSGSRFVFMSERGAPLTPRGFAQMLSRAAASIDFPFSIHPHMLRHACGYKLANDGHDTRALQDYLGHRQIQQTVRYTDMAAGRFNGFWAD